jgi:hypothetical protein
MPIQLPPQMEKLTDEEWKKRGVTREEFTKRWAERLKLDESSPQVGDQAPDFELELLSQTGERTGKLFKLSSVRGKPVGLIFGSYT